MPKVYVTKI